MKLVMISDTHCMHRDIVQMPLGDVLVHAGDMVSMREVGAYLDMVEWLNELGYEHNVIIPGNHDLIFEEDEEFGRELFAKAKNTHLLINEEVVIEGFKFYGAPQTPRFCDWGFNVERGQLHRYWDDIPEDTDVLVTHGPLSGYGDQNDRGIYCGCEELLEAVQRVQPKIHVCGHIHEGHGIHQVVGIPTVSVNASTCTARYKPTNQPLTINIYP